MDVAHYVYSPLKRAELVMIAYNTIIPSDKPKMTIDEAVEVIDRHTPLVKCLGEMKKSEITSIISINGIDFKCEIRNHYADISDLKNNDNILDELELAKKELYKGADFLAEVFQQTGINGFRR